MADRPDGDNNTRTHLVIGKDAAVGHFRIIDRIGAGGMGEVYLAQDVSLDRRVALKFLPSQMCQDEECRSRFKREARAAAKLSHPNIITVHEVGEYQGRPFFSMEHVEGQTLREHGAGGKLTTQQIVAISIQICEGLQAAHQEGVVHRDIKPSNILLDSGNRARIADFGLATVRGAAHLTRTGETAGTPSYMSPEQVRGEPSGVASDLFSLGIVMYEMLTGERPFTGDYEASIIYSILNEDPSPIENYRPNVPPALDRAVMKLLEKDIDKRFQSTSELLDVLRPIAKELSGSGPVHKAGSGRRTNFGVTAGLLAAFIAVLVAAHVLFDPLNLKTEDRKMLAVMPFENLGPPQDEYFADGVTEAVWTHLAKFGDLGVISRASSMRYKGSGKSPQEIGEELGATYLLTGTVAWEKSDTTGKVRISTELVKAEDGSNVWANSYERVLGRIFDMQSDIAQNVTRALKIAVRDTDRQELARVPTDNLLAYDYFLRGNEYFNRSWDREDIEIATQLYEKAVELDSGFALAFAALARGHASMYWEYYDRSDERRKMAVEAATRALDLQPDLVEGHLAMGYCHYHCVRDYKRALAEFATALQKQPNNADLHNAIAAVKRRQSDLDGALENFLIALELDPRSHLRAFDVGLTYGMMRRYDKADEYLARTITLAPELPLPYIFRAWLHILKSGDVNKARSIVDGAAGRADLASSKYYWWLKRLIESDHAATLAEIRPGTDTAGYFLQRAQLYRLMERPNEMLACADSARTILEENLRRLPEDAMYFSSLGLAYAYLGMKERAIGTGKRAVDLLPTTREAFDTPFLILNLAEVMVVCGEYQGAAESLKHLLSVPGFASPYFLQLDPLWDPLRDRDDFKSLLVETA